MRYNHRSGLAPQSTGYEMPSGGVTLVESRPEWRGTREQHDLSPVRFQIRRSRRKGRWVDANLRSREDLDRIGRAVRGKPASSSI